MSKHFSGSDTWLGGYYELAIELGPRSDERLLAALSTIWSDSALDGVYLSRDSEPNAQRKYSLTVELLEVTHLQGLARLPNGVMIACGTCVIRYDNGNDWLDLYLPMGALATAYPVGGYPFEPDVVSSHVWRSVLDPWLVEIGRRVYDHVPYRLGLVGFEVSAEVCASEIAQTGIPVQHYPGLLWPTSGKLTYYPSTI